MPDFDDHRPRRVAPPDHLIRNVVVGIAAVVFVAVVVLVLFVARGPGQSTPVEPAVADLTPTPGPAATPTPTPTPTPEPTPPNHAVDGNLQAVGFVVTGGLNASLAKALPADQTGYASILASQAAAVLSWKLNVKRDLRPGDVMKIVYNPTAQTARVPLYGVWYRSKQSGEELFYVFYPTAAPATSSFFDADGHGVVGAMERPPIPKELLDSTAVNPVGTDAVEFVVPMQTRVIMPFPGRVLRLNWDPEHLGRSVEVRYLDSGVIAQFGHLETISDRVQEDVLISSGEVIATSGRTGNVSSPRLLYRTQRPGENDERTPVNPFELHGRQVSELPRAEFAAFRAAVARIEALFKQVELPEIPPVPSKLPVAPQQE